MEALPEKLKISRCLVRADPYGRGNASRRLRQGVAHLAANCHLQDVIALGWWAWLGSRGPDRFVRNGVEIGVSDRDGQIGSDCRNWIGLIAFELCWRGFASMRVARFGHHRIDSFDWNAEISSDRMGMAWVTCVLQAYYVPQELQILESVENDTRNAVQAERQPF